MLRLILGISGTGKTGRVLAEMKVRAAARRRSILLVPEQFSSSAETMVYRSLGDAFSACAEVYSFTSFAELVLKTFGGAAVKTLTDAARAVAVRRAMDTLGDELQAYRRHRRSTGFCSMCADAIKELKTAGASPETLLDVARTAGEDGGKLHELGLIFAAYEALIAGSAMDPADRISAAALRLDPAFLADKAVFIDNFDGFTAPEYRMLEKLVEAEECTVTLCCDGLSDNEAGLGLFSPVKNGAESTAHCRQAERGDRRAACDAGGFSPQERPGPCGGQPMPGFRCAGSAGARGLFCHACRRCLRRVQGRSLPHRRACARTGAALRRRCGHLPRDGRIRRAPAI
ncbi:PD-(D/E)XK nuclease family protein [Ruthenibacterium lactatiformans]|uniref:PD-(D/E)XK nuclease family protein n=1 Tax=Ruthenibacterium lactatiformans TaxID=1550024 RepID=UPI0039A3F027